MKKFLSLFVLASGLTLAANAQDSMNKKIDNKTDKMVKKMDNTSDKMVKKIENKPKEGDTTGRKSIPKARKPKDN